MNATQQRANVDRCLLRWLTGGGIAPLVAADDLRRVSLDQPRWLRAYATDTAATYSGRTGAARVARVQRRLVVECWCRLGVSDTEPVDGAQQLADAVAARLQFQRLVLLNLIADPAGGTDTGWWIRNLRPPTTTYAPPADAYAHRLVEADFDILTVES